MADIYVSIHNQNGVSMSSVNGSLIEVLVARDGAIVAQQAVSVRQGTAFFQSLPAGNYAIIARHPDLNPTESRYDVGLSQLSVLGIRFIYNETQLELVRIDSQMRFLP